MRQLWQVCDYSRYSHVFKLRRPITKAGGKSFPRSGQFSSSIPAVAIVLRNGCRFAPENTP